MLKGFLKKVSNLSSSKKKARFLDERSLNKNLGQQVASFWYIEDFLSQKDAVHGELLKKEEVIDTLVEAVKEKQSYTAKKEEGKVIDFYLGKIPRENIVMHLGSIIPEIKNNPEFNSCFVEELGFINAIHFSLDNDSESDKYGCLKTLEVSPLLLLLENGKKYEELSDLSKDYESIEKEFRNLIPAEEKVNRSHLNDIIKKMHKTFSVTKNDETLEWIVSKQWSDSFLSAFYKDDLKLVAEKLKPDSLCDRYLSVFGNDKRREQIDIFDSGNHDEIVSLFKEALDPEKYPLGKWPSRYPLATMQQFAVNMYSDDSESEKSWDYIPGPLMAVNGPPGTGKTTLLKDIIAAVVVQKAIILSRYKRPDDMFVEKSFSCEKENLPRFGEHYYSIKSEADAVNDYSILVCSSNNAAVENITVELPKKSDLLDSLESNSSDSEDYINDINKIADLFGRKSSSMGSFDGGKKQEDIFFTKLSNKLRGNGDEESCWGLISVPLGNRKNKNEFWPILEDIRKEISFEESENKKAIKRYEDTVLKFNAALLETQKFQTRLQKIDTDTLSNFVVNVSTQGEENKAKEAHLVVPGRNADYDKFDRLREELFFWALQVIRDFTLSSKCCFSNFTTLLAIERGCVDNRKYRHTYDNDREFVMPSLMQTLFLVIPVISSTFASVGGLFKYVKDAETLGLLIVDEAGQALPYCAAGAMYRSRRAIVVGDPKQVEPVEQPDKFAVLTNVLGKNIPSEYKKQGNSVQRFADEQNLFGTYYRESDAQVNPDKRGSWVGCPLLIHRRCESPMFDISNIVSYGGLMHKATLTSKANETLCRNESLWIDVSGKEEPGGKNHFVKSQGEEAFLLLKDSFEKNNGISNIFVIAPFRSVVHGFRDYIKERIDDLKPVNCSNNFEKEFRHFLNANIGTVHTFQGKEAKEVIFILGCDEEASGAVAWVSSNIVNVAASRAKNRLYVIGDSFVWKSNPYVSKMKKILDKSFADQIVGDIHIYEKETRDNDDPDTYGYKVSNGSNGKVYRTLPQEAFSLSDKVYEFYGFSNEAEFDEFYSQNNSDEDRYLKKLLKSGMKLSLYYDLVDKNHCKSEDLDSSPCLVQFGRAAELFMRMNLFPLIKNKNACGNHKWKNKKTLCELKDEYPMTLGAYEKILHSEMEKLSSLCGKEEGNRDNRSVDWWKEYVKKLKEVADIRNGASHPDKKFESVEKFVLLKDRLFETNDDIQSNPCGILRDYETIELLKRGIEKAEENPKKEFGSDLELSSEMTKEQKDTSCETVIKDPPFIPAIYRIEGCPSSSDEYKKRFMTFTENAGSGKQSSFNNSRLRKVKKGEAGERNVSRSLELSNLSIIILHDLTLKFGEHRVQIDFLIVTPEAIVVVEVKNYSIKTSVEKAENKFRFYWKKSEEEKEGIFSPIHQNEMHVNAVREILRQGAIEKGIKESKVHSLVVFCEKNSLLLDGEVRKELSKELIEMEDLPSALVEIDESLKHNQIDNEVEMVKRAKFFAERNLSLEQVVDEKEEMLSITQFVDRWKKDSKDSRLDETSKLTSKDMNILLRKCELQIGGPGAYCPSFRGREKGLVLVAGIKASGERYIANKIRVECEKELRSYIWKNRE